MNSPVLTEMRTQYSLLRQEADRIGTRLGPRHPERVAIDAQVDAARRRVEQELRLVASSIQVELRRAVQLEQELAARLAQLKARQAGLSGELVTLREFEREAAAKRAVYEAFLLRAGETGQQRDLNTANVSVISKASPPLEPSGPSRTMMTLVGAFLGFGTGVGIGAARGVVDSLRADGAGGHPGQTPRRVPIPRGGSRRFRREETADRTSPDAHREARDTNLPEDTAATAEETDMHHARAPMGWTPNEALAPADPYSAPGDFRPYPEAMQAQRAPEPQGRWMYVGGAPAGHAAYPQAPVDLQTSAYPQAQSYLQGYAPAHPGMQPHYGQAAAPQMPQRPVHGQYPAQPQAWNGQPPAQHYMPQQVDPRCMPQYPYAEWPVWGHTPQPAMPEPGYPYAYPQAMAPGWPQQGLPQSVAVQPGTAQPRDRRDTQPAQQASAAGDGDKSAMEEIRDSLREFREALRDLAESRGRRRFL
jgi:hypothetical protein